MLSRDPDLRERQARHLLTCWQDFAGRVPRRRLAEAARRLGVAEADLLTAVTSHQHDVELPGSLRATPLHDPVRLLSGLNEVGPLLIASENSQGGMRHLAAVSAVQSCHDGLILAGDGLVLTIRFSDLGSLFLVHEQGGCACGQRTSIQIFDNDGHAALRLYRTRDTDLYEFTTLVDDHCGAIAADHHHPSATTTTVGGEVLVTVAPDQLSTLLGELAAVSLPLEIMMHTGVGTHSVTTQLRHAQWEDRHHAMAFANGCAGIQHDGLGEVRLMRYGPTVVLTAFTTDGQRVASIAPTDDAAGLVMWERLGLLRNGGTHE